MDERIAWASIQFHCECSVNQTRITAPTSYELPPSDKEKRSSFPVGTMAPVVFKTEPNIFTIDLRLRAGEKKTFNFSEKIPSDAPPSYSGGFVKERVYRKTL